MSILIGASKMTTRIERGDYTTSPQWWANPITVTWFAGDYSTPWWGRGVITGDLSVDSTVLSSKPLWVAFEPVAGAVSLFGMSGVTRDVYGSPLGGVTVKVFRTADDVLVSSIISDPSGNFTVTTPYYPDTHYLVTYKTGSPDVFGSSTNTLQGS